MRSAVAFGIKNIICIEGTTDVYAPKVVRSSMGTLQKVNVYNIKESEIEDTFETIKSDGYRIIGTSLNTDKYIDSIKINDKDIFVLGNEANGMSEYVEEMCDLSVKINIEKDAESLNVSVAGALLMYEQYKNSNK